MSKVGVLALQGAFRVAGVLKPVLVALTLAWAALKIQVLLTNSAMLKSVMAAPRSAAPPI